MKFSKPIKPEEMEAAYEQGMIRKKDLENRCYYRGHCRNARIALWYDGKFYYLREKFGQIYSEPIFHPEDDNGFDLFKPMEKVEIQW